jgi:sterol 3beta-glucosyltransferase
VKVLLITHGSRGDVQPFAALALALTMCGHEVVLACPAGSAALAAPYCDQVIPLDDGTNKMVNDRKAWEAVEINFRGLRGKRLGLEFMYRNRIAMGRVFDDLVALPGMVTADIVVHQVNVPGQAIASRLGVPAVAVCLQPFWVPTSSFPDPLFPFSLPQSLNRASYLTTKLFVRGFTGSKISLRPDGPVLQGFSRHILPDDAVYPESVHTLGFFFLPAQQEWSPSPELARFLSSGEPPVYIGFGSMVGSDPSRTARIVAEAVRDADVRAVVALGRGGIRPEVVEKDVLYLDQAPHDWLFPRMAAVVHHGGAGTTGAALAAGRPQVICPFMFDQPYFGRRLHACGVAPAPLPLRQLTSDGLAQAIEVAVNDELIAAQAELLGHLVRTENGAHQAVKVLESVL